MADLHTHVIPGVDDGAPDLDSSLAALGKLSADGITAVAATPHLNASNPNSQRRARADAVWPELVALARHELPGLELYRGYEIQLDTPDLDLSDPGLRLAGSRFALVEFYAFTIPERSAEALGRIGTNGHVPIVVHPERYWGYDRDYRVVSDWRRAGALLQINSGSVLGEYGEAVRSTALRFLQEGWVDLLASDNHARPERSPSLRAAWDYLAKRGNEEKARLLLATNPHRILKDQVPVPVGRVEPRHSFVARIARALKGERR
ncbi:MAG TPA: CpsB/CapC family capsule biosynthesis tyrosine phosphatase [Gemmatimonadota bacterium]|nr:CpsB/CapC family capsule biosynthesis tyrosine phosphatase [Gemmatimonadota bacterium]